MYEMMGKLELRDQECRMYQQENQTLEQQYDQLNSKVSKQKKDGIKLTQMIEVDHTEMVRARDDVDHDLTMAKRKKDQVK